MQTEDIQQKKTPPRAFFKEFTCIFLQRWERFWVFRKFFGKIQEKVVLGASILCHEHKCVVNTFTFVNTAFRNTERKIFFSVKQYLVYKSVNKFLFLTYFLCFFLDRYKELVQNATKFIFRSWCFSFFESIIHDIIRML